MFQKALFKNSQPKESYKIFTEAFWESWWKIHGVNVAVYSVNEMYRKLCADGYWKFAFVMSVQFVQHMQ